MTRALGNAVDWLETQSPQNLESNLPYLAVRYAAAELELSESEKVALAEMLSIFHRYHNQSENLASLRYFLHQLSDPQSEATIIQSKRGIEKSLFMFTEQVNLKTLLKYVLSLVRNRVNEDENANLPRYKTIRTGGQENKKEEARFQIESGWQQKLRLNLAKRRKVRGKFNDRMYKVTRSRILRYQQAGRGDLCPLPTLLNAAGMGHYNLAEQSFAITKSDFQRAVYAQNEIFNIMLVLDVSKSISWVIPHIEKLVSCLSDSVSKARDKLGLITFCDDLAQIYHYPTLNVLQVIGTINQLEVKGATPLGEGLQLANQVLGKSKYRLAGMKNLVILISDCFPEPLEGGHENLLDEPSYKKVIKTAEQLSTNRVRLMIINPAQKGNKTSWSKKLIEVLMKNWGTRYLELNPVMSYNLFKGEKEIVDKRNLEQLMEMMGELKVEM
ncbi:MAG: VWA domain-containing protein [Candidatus Cloacimonetes bacterium]|nr:VWA domain-containing protein [Candidatus Cloacimonadota bacterium]